MPFWRTYYHLVWATKNRAELITPEIEPALFQYVTNNALSLDGRVYAISGWTEHMHIVGTLPPKISISDVVKNLKGSSSHYINEQGLCDRKFAWQRGYGVLTLGETQLEKAIKYVENQKEHHANHTVNSWLERVDAEDEGPLLVGLEKKEIPRVLKEDGPIYRLPSEIFPF